MSLFDIILDWSEVWALLIPLTVIMVYRQFSNMELIVWYVIIAIILNGFSTTSYFFNKDMPSFLKNNNIFYNLHSIARVVFFGLFIYRITPRKKEILYRIITVFYLFFILVNFIFIKSPFYFSTWLYAAESIILLFVCILFYFAMMQDDSRIMWTRHPYFLIVTGVAFYEAITFFIFLFIIPLAEKNPEFGLLCLKIYKISFIMLCILIGIALLKSRKKILNTKNREAA